MTIAAVADTHTAVWYLSSDPRLSFAAERFIAAAAQKRNKVAISSVSLAEMVYLVEKQRIPASAFEELLQALDDPEHVFVEAFSPLRWFVVCRRFCATRCRTCQIA